MLPEWHLPMFWRNLLSPSSGSTYQTTLCRNPEDHSLNLHVWKPQISLFFLWWTLKWYWFMGPYKFILLLLWVFPDSRLCKQHNMASRKWHESINLLKNVELMQGHLIKPTWMETVSLLLFGRSGNTCKKSLDSKKTMNSHFIPYYQILK
jgi:hypothetical protein